MGNFIHETLYDIQYVVYGTDEILTRTLVAL